MDTLSLDSKLSPEVLVSGETSHTWILDSGASLHVTPHRDWFTRYEETYSVVTLGDSEATKRGTRASTQLGSLGARACSPTRGGLSLH